MFWWQEIGKIEIFIKGKRYSLKTSDVKKYLEKEVARCLVDEEFYTTLNNDNGINQKVMYYNVLHFMVSNIKHTVKIQVYNDGVVRMYQGDDNSSVWWDTPDCYTHPLNLYLLDKFIEFVNIN